MSKILVVFGATGQQGGSVINFVLNDPELSKEYSIRGITRDLSSSKSQQLEKKNVSMIQGDIDDEGSLHKAMKGAHTIFLMGAPTFGADAKAKELAQGKKAADIAVAEGIQYIIFSTLPHVEQISGGKYTKVSGFDAKAETEDYIRKLPVKSAFFAPGSFMQNFHQMMRPQRTEDGKYIISRHVSPQTKLPLIDTVGDTGKYVGAILAEPEKYEGKVFCSATALYTNEEMAQIISKATGKEVIYVQIPEETFRQYLPPWGDMLIEMMSYQQDFGYYGSQTQELVSWAGKHARGKLTTFEEYLEQNPLHLE